MSFTVPYSRPTALSDPYFDHSEEVCQRILATPDGELDWSDFQAILGPFLPAGTYEEAVYFLPMAFDYCLSNERDGIEVITSVIWFSSQFADRLKHDRVVDAARNAITDILLQATRNFRVVHLDRDACAKQGWGLQYEDIVLLSRHVCCAVEDLTRFARHYDLADWLVGRLAYHRDDVVRAAWFLELARKLQDDVTSFTDPWRRRLRDRTLLEGAAAVVIEKLVPHELSPTYWNDTLRTVVGI